MALPNGVSCPPCPVFRLCSLLLAECKRSLNLCVLGDQVHCDAAAAIKMPFLSVEDMKALKKDKKKVKDLANKCVFSSFPRSVITVLQKGTTVSCRPSP
jgi:hypothetical protein